METDKTNNHPENSPENEPQPKKSWFERNLWLIAIFIAIFLIRMGSQLAK